MSKSTSKMSKSSRQGMASASSRDSQRQSELRSCVEMHDRSQREDCINRIAYGS